MLATYDAVRYLTPLKEGGSLPAIVEMAEGDLFVVKFRGAGQGAKALIAELLVGEIARLMGLPIPEIALVSLPESIMKGERDPEIQDILAGSIGVNVGLRYLEGAFMFDPLAVKDLDPSLVARIVWLDALTTNVDRSHRNPNILYRTDGLWLIDHGATLYFHHNWEGLTEETVNTPFRPISQHILLSRLDDPELFRKIDAESTELLTEDALASILADVPDELLMDAPEGSTAPFESPEAGRKAYLDYFLGRLRGPRSFVDEALRAAEAGRDETLTMQGYRK